MAEIVNLRRVRKDRARKEAKQAADANAALHGRGKAEAALEEARAAKALRDHEAHKRETPPGDPDGV
ncbi:DUF4169 family protein [Neomegalonema sp.]|uniref:DUF4169 family protein n=1 Tax=Neomegalonema sp. TaxID=2039713 RepID=UPI0026140164|nr:DUF4169 family protein [Neomegalonema sp.]MDD2868292.1 DUF4169 family protein [Neomegalonema sp.]